MSLWSNPIFRKFLITLGTAVLTATAGQAISLRDTVRDQEQRIQAVEEATAAVPKIKEDLAVLRDRSDREWGVKK